MIHPQGLCSLERMELRRRATVVSVALVALLLAGCGSASTGDPPGSAAASGVPMAAPPSAPAATVTKLLVVVEENHTLSQMKSGMPYTFRLAKRFGYATHYRAISHPSLPNYIAIAAGKTYGITDDSPPADHPLAGVSVFGQALARHRSATVYAQSMPGDCATADSGPYAVRHNPWTYFSSERSQCKAHDVPMRQFPNAVAAGRLPRVGMVVPDVNHDAHDGSLQEADAWFRSLMAQVFAGPDWRSGHLAVVLTADEGDGSQGNRVLTVVIHPSQHHHVVRQPLSHYSLTRLYDEVAGLPLLNHARTAPSMAKAFGLPVG